MRRTKFLTLLALACAAIARAQAPTASPAGDWEGTPDTGAEKLRLTLHIAKTGDGMYLGKLVTLDQGDAEPPVGKATVDGLSVTLDFPLVSGGFKGELSEDGSQLEGTWTQGDPLPLTFERTGKAPASEPPKPPAVATPSPFGPPVEVAIPASPIPFRGAAGQSHLIYELHITNFSDETQSLTRIEVLGDKGSLASFEGKELLDTLMQPGVEPEDTRKIGPGLRAVAFLTVPLPDGVAPAALRHRLTVSGSTVDLAPIAMRTAKAIVIGPPLRGSDWLAANGPNNNSIHRRAILALNGRVFIAQRFAIDWVQLKTQDSTFTSDPRDNRNYKAYGADVLAVADATVVAAKDGIPQNIPGADSRAVPMTIETLAGNYIILDLGGGNYCMYAHLQPGSLKVKPGDKVKRGQVLGLLGNSGNSTEPHLHFQVMDGATPLGAEGLPYLIDSFELLSGRSPGKKENALPMQNMRVKFGQ